jgi:hypothetical protein
MHALAPWNFSDEVQLRRQMLLSNPAKAEELEPMPAVDWIARMSIREFAPPTGTPYNGPRRRKSDFIAASERQ